ncbi:winged helix-turn-helix domain-containing protein [Nocardia puris]|uniref:BTAD domain-containing putative transcriptional regulator n=1 Tax=Nocardia puris TaxID=208602 RepID=UPI0014747C2D|nr:BTAD domain-containing putative transcriptional regulator [Nocardia puris]MBF6215492.1 winged helix-turn-helix domain-containing protein [Nocardia puris]MBF6369895.1 winged helix-turn-helix domain-containing protein [Nocardia puris]MBF6462766.1 winged helix-turn-helix domain-containing protein [Nocardia puris]
MRQRTTLAYLLLHPNTVVPASRLMDALWPNESMPTSARKILHNAVWGLRNLLPDDSATPFALTSRPPGYIFEVDTDLIDLHRFYRLAARGRADAAAGDLDSAAARLCDALSLWRGSAVSDLTEHGVDWPELTAAEDARMSVAEDYFDIELERGHHVEVIDPLSKLAESGLLRERSCGQLMLALYRSRRPSDALGVYTDWRNSLIENFGLEPGPELQRLQQSILRQSPSLLPSAAVATDEAILETPAPVTPINGGPTDRVTVLFLQVTQPAPAQGDQPVLGDRFHPTICGTISALGGVVVGAIGSTTMTVFPRACAPQDVVAAALHFRGWIAAAGMGSEAVTPRFRAAVVTGAAARRIPRTYAELRRTAGYGDLFDDCERLLLDAPVDAVAVGECARRETEHLIRYVPHPSGQWHAAAVHTAPGAASEPEGDPDPDVRTLLGLRDRVRERQVSHLVAVVAPASVNARRATRGFRHAIRARRDSEPVLSARFGGPDPLGVHRTMLAGLCDLRAGDAPADIRAKLAEVAGHPLRSPSTVHQIAEALYPLARSLPLDPFQTRAALAAWLELLCAEAGLHPTTLVFDDAHLADETSLVFLETLLDSAEHAPLLVVLSGETALVRSGFVRIAGTRESTLLTADSRSPRRSASRRLPENHLTAGADRSATASAAS